MVDAIVSTALQKLHSILQNELSLLTGLQGELEKLSTTFATIQAMLEDAESRRVNERSVTIWLEKLKDLAYYIDDILDEWGTEALIPKDSEDDDGGSLFGKKKVSNFLFLPFSCFSHSVLRHRIGNSIKDARERLDEIAKEASQLHLRVDSGERERADIKVRRHETRERETSSQVDDSAIIGREHEKNEIIELLVRESSQEGNGVLVISIIGMGGLGKTTLAQLAYNDEKVKEHFDMRMWVCVSEDFDVKRITESVLKSATGTGCESLDLDQLQCRLRELLQGKRFLLVLDDIWNEDSEKWDKLRLPFQNGAQGSRLIITTRSENVSLAMGNTQMHKLQVLSNDDCWLLFSQRARTDQSINGRFELEKIGRKIVKKCGGVPLAAKTIGSAMRSKRTRREWELVMESETWNSPDVLQPILPALLLSYYSLPSALKQCFAYCSIFPKGWWIERALLVKLWVAQGYIHSDGSGDLEEIGELYLEDLLRRSLLQDAGNIFCIVHDLIHDLARLVARSDCAVMDFGKLDPNLSKARHCSLVCRSNVTSIPATSPLYKANKLRTFILLRSSILSTYHLPTVPNDLFHHLRCLRALDLNHSNIVKLPQTVGKLIHLRYLDLSDTNMEELPRTVGNLKHLRFLDISHTKIQTLPETVGYLHNLQTLKLNWCSKLCKLPKGTVKMISLRHLEFEGINELKYLPQGIGKLSGLRKLSAFIVGTGVEECDCGELKQLNLLQGRLEITNLDNVRSMYEAREAELDKKQHLQSLILRYQVRVRDELRRMPEGELERMADILERFRPSENLKELEIWFYPGSKLPNWIEDPSFANLVRLELHFCNSCQQLPCLGKLMSLQRLRIDSMAELTSLSSVGLGKLKALRTLEISWCPVLRSLPKELRRLRSLQKLVIEQCPLLKKRCRYRGKDWQKISHIPHLTIDE